MKRRDVRYESDPSLDHVEIIIRAPEQDEEVRSLMDRMQDAPSALKVFDGNDTVRILTSEEVITATTEGKLVQVVTADGIWFTRRTLQSMETMLNEPRFVRVSRHELVNLDKVLRYEFTGGGTLRLEMVGGTETWASRRCIPEIRKRLLERK